MSRDHPNCIIKINQNTKKSLRDWKRLAATQTPVEKPSAYASVKNSLMSFDDDDNNNNNNNDKEEATNWRNLLR